MRKENTDTEVLRTGEVPRQSSAKIPIVWIAIATKRIKIKFRFRLVAFRKRRNSRGELMNTHLKLNDK